MKCYTNFRFGLPAAPSIHPILSRQALSLLFSYRDCPSRAQLPSEGLKNMGIQTCNQKMTTMPGARPFRQFRLFSPLMRLLFEV
jgi:hypothetical protein